MRTQRPIDVNTTVMAVTIAVFVALIGYLTLVMISRPSRLTPRLAEASARADEAAGLTAASRGLALFPAGTVCADAPAPASHALEQRLRGAAAAAGVTLGAVTTAPSAGDEALGGLTQVTFQVDATGRYEAVMAMLGTLGSAGPKLFIDTADLKSETPTVALKLSGREFCSTAAPL
jgi:hypothetical protein